MKTLMLTSKKKNYLMLVDDEDYSLATCCGLSSQGYARVWHAGELKLFHRVLLAASKGQLVDHVDGNRLNNQKRNLRIVTHVQNMMNRPQNKNNASSKYKGVSWIKRDSKWRAGITIMGTNLNLGHYKDEADAAKAYNKAALFHHGEHARLNEIPQ